MNPVPLANAELSVMELLWDHGRLSARQIQDRLYGESDRSQHGTVQRLLQRLEDKQFVRREKGGPPAALDRKSTRLNSSHVSESRMPSSA